MSTRGALGSAIERARATQRSRWWTTFALVAFLCVLWNLATPIFASPDEPAHAIRAASAARLQILGEESKRFNDQMVVDAPRGYFVMAGRIACYAFRRDVPAECAPYPDQTNLAPMPTSAGRHPPAYYIVAGIPSLAFRGDLGLYLMRLVSVLLTAAFVASTVATLERLRRPRIAALGIALAITPMVLFVGGVINPSSAEIAAAVCCWTASIVLAYEAPRKIDRRLLCRVGIAAIVLALSRQLAPLWLALIGAAVFAIAPSGAIRALWKSSSARRWALAIIAAVIVQVGWVVIVRPLDSSLAGDEHAVKGISAISAIRVSFGESLGRFREMVGWFGWLDTPSPGITYACWAVALALLLAIALLAGRRRILLVMVATTIAAVGIPVFFEMLEAANTGFFWQGRYTMPLALGIPILLAMSVALNDDDGEARSGVDRLPRFEASRLVPVIGTLVVVGHLAAYWQALRRNAVGYEGSLTYVFDPDWAPPVPGWLLVPVYAVVAAGFVWWLLSPRGFAPTGASADADDQDVPTPSGSLRYS